MSTVSACFHFGTPNLRMSRHVNLVESVSTLKRQVERKKKRKKENQRTNTIKPTVVFFLGDVKIEMFQEELRQRES